ncbi:MvdC/MvdD family ATP grasp protein [Nonomuraea sp. B10E15]|uniref:MvdC/MvdD family ATP grasp protein n=1 Tax=Nonomuraea sp. B10E15 TaxID=3153560 RepID=UPI00325E5B19
MSTRLDPGRDFPACLDLSAWYGDGEQRATIATTSRHVELAQVQAVYYRRPTPYLHGPAAPQHARFTAAQARFGLGGVLASLRCPYINHPWRIAAAEHKPLQLATARTAGFTIPATLITNRMADARAFADEHGPIIYKPLRMTPLDGADGQPATIWATPVNSDQLDQRVNHAAHLFQARVHKAADIRITAVGNRLFCVRIESGMLDWRQDYEKHRYVVVDPPPTITEACMAYLKHLDLRFAAFDFAVTDDGRWVFLEANPNGQWAWLQDATRLPIAPAIADLLLEGK